jgi:hypothetical protein
MNPPGPRDWLERRTGGQVKYFWHVTLHFNNVLLRILFHAFRAGQS